jgi:KUP system potassium uptake protein
VTSPRGNMGPVLEPIFGLLSRNAMTATAYFRLPPEQVVEIGLQIDL